MTSENPACPGNTPLSGMDIVEILDILPHRYPFLMVDRVLSISDGKKIVAIKNVSINEPFFHGHFPGNPIMPGVLILEGMVQAGGLLLGRSLPKERHMSVCFSGIDHVRFRRPVRPGDTLVFTVAMNRRRSRFIKMSALADVGQTRVAEAELMAVIGGGK